MLRFQQLGRFKLLMKMADRHFESGLSGFVWVTLPQTNGYPSNRWLEDEFSFLLQGVC